MEAGRRFRRILGQEISAQLKKKVKIAFARFWSGFQVKEGFELILRDFLHLYDFEVSSEPTVVLYGPYPGDMPQGKFKKVFIGCENLRPLMKECDWAFGVDREELVNHPRYMRLRGCLRGAASDDESLVKQDKDWEEVFAKKKRFCAFIYSHRVSFRERFFLELSKYKPVDAPGLSMNNMPSFDPEPGKPDWDAKIRFLTNYKFVIAFENDCYPGYNTEKIRHAIMAQSIPIYWGDPLVHQEFNTRSFVNFFDYQPAPRVRLPRVRSHLNSLRRRAKLSFAQRVRERVNRTIREVEMCAWSRKGFQEVIRRVVELDTNDDLYLACLKEPFFHDNRSPDRTAWINRWREIFDS